MKTVAWRARHAARDLYDLAALAGVGGLTQEAADLVRRVSGARVAPFDFDDRQQPAWHEQLAHQTRLVVTPRVSLRASARLGVEGRPAIGAADEPRTPYESATAPAGPQSRTRSSPP
jgi:hypothetical protein